MAKTSKTKLRNSTRLAAMVLCFIVYGCYHPAPKEVEFRQSFASGKAIYEDQCQQCHQDSGQGLGKLYPPLANADYLKSHIEKLPCIIYNGMSDSIIVNGIQYNWEMPAHPKMDEIQLSAILTYLRDKWGGKKDFVSYKDASMAIAACKAQSVGHSPLVK